MKSPQKASLIIYGFAILKLLVPFIFIHPAFQLQRDEYLYLADANHLAWGYIEMPPMLAWLGALGKSVSHSVSMVYCLSAGIGALTIILTGKIVQRLNGGLFAIFLACLAFFCSVFLRMHILFQPNILDIFFWTLSCYYIICWIQNDHKKYLYYIGICFGLGILSKYTIAFFILAFLLAVVLSPKRKWLINRHFYLAMFLALAIASPNLWWQYQHNFPVLHHMRLLTTTQLDGNSRTTFFIEQLLMFIGAFYLILLGLWYSLFHKEGKKYRPLAIMFISILLIIVYAKGKSYYTAGIYPVMLALGSVFLERITHSKFGTALRIILPTTGLVATAFIFPLVLPFMSPQNLSAFYKRNNLVKTGLLTWEDRQPHPLPQDFADMLGWKELAEKTLTIYDDLPDSSKKNTIIFGDNYGHAGAVEFYKGKRESPLVYSDDASFLFWLPTDLPAKTNFILLSHRPREIDDFVFKHFKHVQILDSITNPFAREFGTKIIFYAQPDDSLSTVLQQAVSQLKSEFNAQ